jgi:ribonuclease HI
MSYNDKGGLPMSEYRCYFDASYKENTAQCAYYIKRDDSILHTKVNRFNAESPEKAEAQALLMLLQYIDSHIESSCKVSVYGDALSVISAITSTSKRKKRFKGIRRLFHSMKNRFDISIEFIPRKMNVTADRLSKAKSINLPLPIDANIEMGFVGHRHIAVDDIVVPKEIKYSSPSKAKFNNRLEYFTKTGKLYRTIQIDENNVLLDGFISYLILKRHGIAECDAEVYKFN